MSQRSISSKDLDEAITSDDILGKEVIDAEGRFIGVAEKVFIHPNTLDFIGISIDKGFLKKGLSIGKNYIERVATHAVFLNIRVAFELKGMEVFDKNGKLLGKVTGIELEGSLNKIQQLHVSGIFEKSLSIPQNLIDNIGYNVLLNVTKEELIAKAKAT